MLLGRRGRKGNEDKCLFKIQWKVSEHLTKNTLSMSLDARYHLFCIVFEITTRCLCLPGNITGANSSKLPISTRFLKAYLHMCSKRAFEFSSCGLWGVCLKFWSMLWAHLYVFWSWPEYKEQGFNRIKTALMLWSSSTLLGYEESKERSSEMEVGFDWAGKGSLRLCRGKFGSEGDCALHIHDWNAVVLSNERCFLAMCYLCYVIYFFSSESFNFWILCYEGFSWNVYFSTVLLCIRVVGLGGIDFLFSGCLLCQKAYLFVI